MKRICAASCEQGFTRQNFGNRNSQSKEGRRAMRHKLILISLVSLVMAGGFAHGQQVFTNGISVDGYFVISNGFITLESTTNTQDDAGTRALAPSVGQMYGVNPDDGSSITNNGDLLTFKPILLDLETAANRSFVIRADQIVEGGGINVGYLQRACGFHRKQDRSGVYLCI